MYHFGLALLCVGIASIVPANACNPGRDTSPPTFSERCPRNLGTRYASSTPMVVRWSEPTAEDNRGTPTVRIISGKAPGSSFGVGYHVITYQASDSAGNTANCQVTFTVALVTCPRLSSPSNGNVFCSNERYVGSVCTYDCSEGYDIHGGSVNRQCKKRSGRRDGYWGGTAPSCVRIQCSSLSAPNDGSLTCTDGFFYASTCTFSCNAGYTLQADSSTSTCLNTGLWSNSGTAISCEDTTSPTFTSCPQLGTIYAPPLSLASIVTWSPPSASDNSGEDISPVRIEGGVSGSAFDEGLHQVVYRAVDSAGNEAQCSIQINVAVVRCDIPVVTSPIQADCPNGYILGSVCEFSCSQGYIVQGHGSAECQMVGTSGVWSEDTASCQALLCPSVSLQDALVAMAPCSRSYGSVCRLGCEPGYELIGNSELTCTAEPDETAATWAGDIPSCARIQCTQLPESTGLQTIASPECPEGGGLVSSGNQCQFTCSPGYYLRGDNVLTCQDNRTWAGEVPTCRVISCEVSELPVPEHAELRECTNEREVYGTACTLVCHHGYEPYTPVHLTCSDDGDNDEIGVWSGALLTCTAVDCPAPLPPANGTVEGCWLNGVSQNQTSRMDLGVVCAFSCFEGYKMSGAANRSCATSGEWEGASVTCTDVTPPVLECPPDREYWTGSMETSVLVPWEEWEPLMAVDLGARLAASLYSIDSVELSGINPQTLEEGAHTLVYRAIDGSGNVATCSFTIRIRVTRCPPLQASSTVNVTGSCLSGGLFGSRCLVTCLTGYTPVGGSEISAKSCNRSSADKTQGFWSGPGISCTVVRCPLPSTMNGFSSDCSTNVTYGTACKFQCNPGYRTPSGEESSVRFCQSDFAFSGQDIQCTEMKTCEAGFDIDHGSTVPTECMASSRLPFGTNCSFSCDDGFQLHGPKTLLCTTDGTWNELATPYCQDIRAPFFDVECPYVIKVNATRGVTTAMLGFMEPVAQDNSGVNITTRITSGSVPVDDVYPEGVTTITYKAKDPSGLYSTCDVRIHVHVFRCPSLHSPIHGSVGGCEDPIYGSSCKFSCDLGYQLVGHQNVSCDLSPDFTSIWDSALPTCRIRMCPQLVVHEPASLSECGHLSPLPYGTVCAFSCPTGFEAVGERQVLCQADGTWTSEDIKCEREACPPLNQTRDVAITPATCLSDPRYHDTCNLTCSLAGFFMYPPELFEVTCLANHTWSRDVTEAICIDVTPPTFTSCPERVVVYSNRSSSHAAVSWTVAAEDNTGAQPTVTCSPEPGLMTAGLHHVSCTAIDERHNDNQCLFDVDVRIRRCSTLIPPEYGTINGSCDTSFGSICHVSCLQDFVWIGSPEASCEYNGTDMYWKYADKPVCEELGCSALLRPFAELQSTPNHCFESGKVAIGTTCTFGCPLDLTFLGDHQPLTCLSSGDWSDEFELLSLDCRDTQAPYITSCPTELITAIRTEIWGVQVTFDPPSAEDKVTSELRVTTYPPDLRSPYNFTSDTTCSYTFSDSANNNASCVFPVSVINEVTPEITYCPPGRNITTNLSFTEVSWEKPTHLDVQGITFQVSCNIADNPVRLPLGDHLIVCYVIDPESQRQAECRTSISLRPVPCIPLHAPTNGFLACDEFAYGQFCSVFCDDQHDIPSPLSRSIPSLYVCGTSGFWLPNSNVPDCTSTRVASRLNLPLDIMYFDGDCSNTDRLKEMFITLFHESNFADLCSMGHDCTVDKVSISCGTVDSRRKRSILAEEGLDSHDSDVIKAANVSIVVGVSPNNYMPGNPPVLRSSTKLKDITAYVHGRIEELFSQNGEAQVTEGMETHRRDRTSLRFKTANIECDHGYVADKDKDICVACPAGYFANLTRNECALCERGFYQDREGQTECRSCPAGTTTAKLGARDVSQCEVPCRAGTYSATGFAPCFMCQKGWYQPITGQNECSACPGGMTTPYLGAISSHSCREPCPAGHISPSGLQPCQPCPRGFYQPSPWRTACNKCGGYTTTQRVGATSDSECYPVD